MSTPEQPRTIVVQTGSTTVASVRKRPGMYIGSCDGHGVMNLVLEVVANALDQHLAGRCKRMTIAVRTDGEIEIADDGAGIAVPLEQVLTVASHAPSVDGHRPHAHLGLGGCGLFVVNALSERFMIATVVDGVETTIRCHRGAIVEGPRVQPTSQGNGTVVRFVPDPMIFRELHVPRRALTEILDDIAFLNPQWLVTWSFASDTVHTQGLAGRVALTTGCSIAEVATHTAQYALVAEQGRAGDETGNISVAVALAWRRGFDATALPAVTSFVNWRRTSAHGDHVDGLYEGITEFASPAARDAIAQGLVAEVAVILADVHWGAPSKDLLVTSTVRAPVVAATLEALQRWAVAQPELAAALRSR